MSLLRRKAKHNGVRVHLKPKSSEKGAAEVVCSGRAHRITLKLFGFSAGER